MKLRLKILLSFAVPLLFIAGASALYVKLRLADQLHTELQKRGISIARHLARTSSESLLARDRLALKMLAVSEIRNEEDIAYIFFLGPNGKDLLAHTFDETFPFALINANPLTPGQYFSLRNLETETGPIYDVAVPVEGGGLGQVRVGLSAEPLRQAVGQLSSELVLVILLLGAIALMVCIPISSTITEPIEDLTGAAAAVAAGDYSQQVAIKGPVEIRQLANTFNEMVERLQCVRSELLASNSELGSEIERRRHAEEQLAAQLSLISLLMDEIPMPVFFKDTAGIYSGCNRAFEAFSGFSREEMVGNDIFALVPAEEAAIHARADRDLFSRPGTCRYELSFTDRSGQTRDVVVQKATYNAPGGELAGMVGILIDVTKDREIDRLRNDFVSTAAHEFQTPLTAILGFCEVLQGDASLPESVRQEYLAIIHERGEFLSRLVDRFLDVSRIDAGKAIPLDRHLCHPDRMLRTLVHNYSARGGRHRFELRLPPKCPPIFIDEMRVAQIIENLLSNAVKYSPAGSRIRIEGTVTGDHFHLDFIDDGVGLTKVQLEKIFDKFYRVDTSNSSPSGTGLGLYICKAIATAHGGDISVSSSPGNGTCFRVTLPLAQPTEPSPA